MQKTYFKGQVNDEVFTSREEMSRYIKYCIDNDIDIKNTSSHTETRWEADEPEKPCQCQRSFDAPDTKKPTRNIIDAWPKEYKTLEEYLAPYMNENVFSFDANENVKINEDIVNKLTRRMHYFEHNFATNDSWTDEGYRAALAPVITRLQDKAVWCGKRMNELKGSNKTMRQRISLLRAELDNLDKQIVKNEGIIEAYDNLGGYCSALADHISDDYRIN